MDISITLVAASNPVYAGQVFIGCQTAGDMFSPGLLKHQRNKHLEDGNYGSIQKTGVGTEIVMPVSKGSFHQGVSGA